MNIQTDKTSMAGGAVTTADIKRILQLIPHRYPMLLVDRVTEMSLDSRAIGIKNVSINEPFFQGHFPGNPVVPGVMQLEAMAQVGGILLNILVGQDGRIAYFLAVDNARFRRMLRPGDQMRIEMQFLKQRLNMARFHGKVFVDGELAVEADLMFGTGRGESAAPTQA